MSNIDNNDTNALISSRSSKRSYTLIDLDLNEYKDNFDSHIFTLKNLTNMEFRVVKIMNDQRASLARMNSQSISI